jgi:hypothetical protein
VRSELSVFDCCGAAKTSTISDLDPVQMQRPGKAAVTIVWSGYLSMNTAAWQTSRTVPNGKKPSISSACYLEYRKAKTQPATAVEGHDGMQTHLAVQALLGSGKVDTGFPRDKCITFARRSCSNN